MKKVVLVLAFMLSVSPATARIGPSWPAPIEEAPVGRAIANVTADLELTAAERERLLGRLHLIGYAQARMRMQHYATGEWAPAGEAPCGDATYLSRLKDRNPGFRCNGIGPRPELPTAIGAVGTEERAHLRAARMHYARAVALDSSVLRARLGLAYVLDELNADDEARTQLREIIAAGLPLLQGQSSDPEIHAILSETVEHLSDLAVSPEDRGSITQIRARLGASAPLIAITPIVVPLGDAPFVELIDSASSVAFDFGGIGDRRALGWLKRNAAWLVWDPNRRGEIHTGFDLIGQRSWGVFWNDGFEALRALDDDGDGELTGTELQGLALWCDADGDGVSRPDEVQPLSVHGVVSLSTRGTLREPGLISAPAAVRFEGGKRRPLYDWTPGFHAAPGS